MKGILKIITEEVGKTLALTANVAADLTLCNIEEVNTDLTTFDYDPSTGELTILRRGVFEISGQLFLWSGTEEVADLTFNLEKNNVVTNLLYTGLNRQRILFPLQIGLEEGDVIKITVTSPDNVTIETEDTKHFITVKRIF